MAYLTYRRWNLTYQSNIHLSCATRWEKTVALCFKAAKVKLIWMRRTGTSYLPTVNQRSSLFISKLNRFSDHPVLMHTWSKAKQNQYSLIMKVWNCRLSKELLIDQLLLWFKRRKWKEINAYSRLRKFKDWNFLNHLLTSKTDTSYKGTSISTILIVSQIIL